MSSLQPGALRIVELLGAIVSCLIAIGLGFHFSRLWAATVHWALLIGIVSGGVCAGGYFLAAVLLGQLVMHSLDPSKIGADFLVLLPAAPICGAIGAFVGYRRTPGVGF